MDHPAIARHRHPGCNPEGLVLTELQRGRKHAEFTLVGRISANIGHQSPFDMPRPLVHILVEAHNTAILKLKDGVIH